MAMYVSATPSAPPPGFNRTDALSVTNNAAAGKVSTIGHGGEHFSVSDALTSDYAAIQHASDRTAATVAGTHYAKEFLLAADYSGLTAGEARSALQGALTGAGLTSDEVDQVLQSAIVSSIADDDKVDAEKFQSLSLPQTNNDQADSSNAQAAGSSVSQNPDQNFSADRRSQS